MANTNHSQQLSSTGRLSSTLRPWRIPGDISLTTRSRGTVQSNNQAYESPILFVLRLIDSKGIAIFPFDPASSWNQRNSLGEGSVYFVEEDFIPQWRERYLPYRDPALLARRNRSHFVDHRGLKWAYDTPVAYKLPHFDAARDQGSHKIVQELATEMRIFCHPSIERHRNFVRLLGVAWVSEEDMNLYATTNEESENEQPVWPIAVIEKAQEGSLKDLFRVRGSGNDSIPLMTKFKLCIDVLRAVQVVISAKGMTISEVLRSIRPFISTVSFMPTSNPRMSWSSAHLRAQARTGQQNSVISVTPRLTFTV